MTAVDFGRYIKAAFANPWNMLAFFGTAALAVMAPRPDITLPLVTAAELGYLTMLGTHPRFRSYVDAQAHKEATAARSETSQAALERILRSIPPKSMARFEELRARCLELRRLARVLQSSAEGAPVEPFDEFQLEGLDRLLWIYLRLLFTEFSLEQFLRRTSAEQIQSDIKRLEGRLAQNPPIEGDSQRARIRETLENNLATVRDRLANLQKANHNHELVKLQIEGLENKIQALSEMSLNRRDPDAIAGQVEQVAQGMKDTERTMSELQFATGLEQFEEAPALMQRPLGELTN